MISVEIRVEKETRVENGCVVVVTSRGSLEDGRLVLLTVRLVEQPGCANATSSRQNAKALAMPDVAYDNDVRNTTSSFASSWTS